MEIISEKNLELYWESFKIYTLVAKDVICELYNHLLHF
jgi:hypothetical protein